MYFPFICLLTRRKSDILLLADHFLQKYSGLYDKPMKRISTSAINMIMAYHWPGNVRELENCIERAVLTSADGVVHGFNLPLPCRPVKRRVLDLSLRMEPTSNRWLRAMSANPN